MMPALYTDSSAVDGGHCDKTVTCVSTGPLFKKMKVLKAIKKKIGVASKTNSSPEVCPSSPLLFHQVCGDNIRIECESRVARRVESFCKGVTFSNRPVPLGEKVCIRLVEISTNWSGVIRFGFTSNDPRNFENSLPKYSCPDLSNKAGFWVKALSERFANQGMILTFSCSASGDVHFGVNNEEKGIFLSDVETKNPLWVVIDVYGNCTTVEFVAPSVLLNNRIINNLRESSTSRPRQVLPPSPQRSFPRSLSLPAAPLVEGVVTPFSRLHLATLQQQPSTVKFHSVTGRNVLLSDNKLVAARKPGEFSHGYIFLSLPLALGETVTIRVNEIDPLFLGALAFGVTAANPAGLETNDLPDDCDLLLDRPEYWVVSKDVAASPAVGDKLSFTLTSQGTVTFIKNRGPPQTIMHVDHALRLWAFFDVYGNTKQIELIPSIDHTPNQLALCNRSQNLPSLDSSRRNSNPASVPYTRRSSPAVSTPFMSNVTCPVPDNSNMTVPPISDGFRGRPALGMSEECTVCYEKAVDSVLYACGHMCMCYECAIQQWQGRGGGLCPICRASIRDVIRTYRS